MNLIFREKQETPPMYLMPQILFLGAQLKKKHVLMHTKQ